MSLQSVVLNLCLKKKKKEIEKIKMSTNLTTV